MNLHEQQVEVLQGLGAKIAGAFGSPPVGDTFVRQGAMPAPSGRLRGADGAVL